jgi:hypothetical protein
MKPFKQNKAGEGENSGAGAPDVAKLVSEGFTKLQAELGNLNKRVEGIEKTKQPAAAPKKSAKEEEAEDEDLATEILVNPTKAVKKLTAKIEQEVTGKVRSEMQGQGEARDTFFNRFTELAQEYPELNDTKSEFHTRAKELLTEKSNGKQWDVGALERAVFAAVSEKGVLPMKHRKQAAQEDDTDEDDYLGSGASSSASRSRQRGGSSDKLDPKTKAFAELCGLKLDEDTVKRLTKTQTDRKGRWNKYS